MNEERESLRAEEGSDQDRISMERRDFLLSLKKWSKVVIGSALFGGAALELGVGREAEAGAWANRALGGGAWANGGRAWANAVGGGGSWANRGGAWANGGGAWANRGGSWVNRF